MPKIPALDPADLNTIRRVSDRAADSILAAFERAELPAAIRARVLCLVAAAVFIDGRVTGALTADNLDDWCEMLRRNVAELAEEVIACRNAKPGSARAAKPRRPRAG